jgi:hypothetical protein
LVHTNLDELEKVEHGIPLRNLSFEVIGTVEMAIVAIHRALHMASQLNGKFAVSASIPTAIANKLRAIGEIRNVYEYIDERALGLVRNKPDPNALSGFNFGRLFQDRVVTYGTRELDLGDEAIRLLIEERQYLKKAVAEITSH